MKLIALDVGEKRIGVAKADSSVKIAVPIEMIPVDGDEYSAIYQLCRLQKADVVIIGMPRNLQGKLTQQSEYVKKFAEKLKSALCPIKPDDKIIKIFFQDESLTTVQARQNLQARAFDKKTGELDSEAAALILQDFLENLSRRFNKPLATAPVQTPTQPVSDAAAPSAPFDVPTEEANTKIKDEDIKVPVGDHSKRRSFTRLIGILAVIVGLVITGAVFWYEYSISAVVPSDKCGSLLDSGKNDPCAVVQFVAEEGSSYLSIADTLKEKGLIRSTLAYKIYVTLFARDKSLKAGGHQLNPSMPVEALVSKLNNNPNAEVFSFTALPGWTLNDIRQNLIKAGYTLNEVNTALSKQYDHPVLVDKPADASLEGYLFGETYEFYKSDSVEKIITRMLDELYTVVKDNNLREKFIAMGHNLHEGIIMASIVQKEAGTMPVDDQKQVAQVFWNRLAYGWTLGSDVTATYAADQVDPDRAILDNNAAVIDIDSCYNTRKYTGLPCGPISNPGAEVLISTANPADTSYLYFLTGDDGKMYYSTTEAEHLQNRDLHCQNLCNTQL